MQLVCYPSYYVSKISEKRIAFAEKAVILNKKIENESQEEVLKAQRITQQAISYIKRNYEDKIVWPVAKDKDSLTDATIQSNKECPCMNDELASSWMDQIG